MPVIENGTVKCEECGRIFSFLEVALRTTLKGTRFLCSDCATDVKERAVRNTFGMEKEQAKQSDTPRTDEAADYTAPEKLNSLCKDLERELAVEEVEKMKYRERAWRAESKLDERWGLRKEITAALGITDETGDDALRKGLETINALKAEREALLEALAWRPIATAPKDGTSIVIRCSGNRMAIARWEQMMMVGTRWAVVVPVLGGFGTGTDTFISYKEDLPTHWMPLPEPPKGVDP